MVKVQPPSPPYVGPAKFHGGAQSLKPLKRIVIHCTVSPCVPGGARATASYFRRTVTRPSSAHYVVDPAEVVQVVGDHQTAFHAPPNGNTIGIELCDPQTGPASRWANADHVAMLDRAAALVAQLCLAYDVPLTRIGPTLLKLGRRGITGHVDVSNAWHQTTHTDPGEGFPWAKFMERVNAHAAVLRGAPQAPPVKPIPVVVPPKPTPAPMTLVTSNIRNNPDLPRPEVRADTAAVSKLGGVILWQEIGEQDDRDDLKTSLPEDKWVHVGLDDECPISLLRSNWRVHRTGRVLLHGGKTGVSPHRVVQWAEVERLTNGRYLPAPHVVVMNTHWVSGPYSHAGQTAEAWRLEMWKLAHAKTALLVDGFMAEGLTVVGGGDFNRTGVWSGFAPSHRWLMHGGYDHLWTCEAPGLGARVALKEAGTLGTDHLYTDHAARWVRLELTPGKVTA